MKKLGTYIYVFAAALILLVALGLFFRPAPVAEAVQIKRSQTSTVTFAGGDTVQTITLPTPLIDLTKSFLISTWQSNTLYTIATQGKVPIGGGEGGGVYAPFFEDNQTINVPRERGDTLYEVGSTVQAYGIEFIDGVNVTKGFTSLTNTSNTKNITLSNVNTSKAIPMVFYRSINYFTTQNEAFTFKATFPPNTTTLSLQRNEAPTNESQKTASAVANFVWQVVEFLTNCTVKNGTVDIGNTSASATVNLTSAGNITYLNKTFLWFTYASGSAINGIDGMTSTRGRIFNESTLNFTRAQAGTGANQQINISWYLVEFNDPSTNVQNGTQSFTASDFSFNNITLTRTVDPARSFPIISVAGGDASANNMLAQNMVRAEINGSGTTLNLTRTDNASITETAIDVDWFVIEMAPLT